MSSHKATLPSVTTQETLFAHCKYIPTILSESLAQARVADTLRAKMERKIWITYSGLPSPPRAVTGKNVLIHYAGGLEKV